MGLSNWIRKILQKNPTDNSPQTSSIFDSFVELMRNPSTKDFLALRQRVAQSPRYDPYSNEVVEMAEHLQKGDARSAFVLFQQSYPSLLLSPAAHLLLSKAHLSLGRKNESEDEKLIGHFLFRRILQTGKGTRRNPYAVMRQQDETDVLQALKKKAGVRYPRKIGGRRVLEIQRCTDGSEVYFDITIIYRWKMKLDPTANYCFNVDFW